MNIWTYWLIAAVLVFVAEMFLGMVYLLVLSVSLALAAMAAFFGANTAVCLLLAAFMSALGTFFVYRNRQKTFRQPETDNDLDIGETVQLEQAISGEIWRVFYRGTIWEAQAAHSNTPFQAGDNAKICGKNGNILLIQPI